MKNHGFNIVIGLILGSLVITQEDKIQTYAQFEPDVDFTPLVILFVIGLIIVMSLKKKKDS